MEYLIVIAVAVAIAVFDDRVRGKKKVPPPTVPQDIPRPRKRAEQNAKFEIPPLRGVPSDVQVTFDAEVLRAQELRSKWEEARREAQRAKQLREREERAVRRAAEETQTAAAVVPQTAVRTPSVLLPQVTADTMARAVVLAEVLGKPRALRKFPQR